MKSHLTKVDGLSAVVKVYMQFPSEVKKNY